MSNLYAIGLSFEVLLFFLIFDRTTFGFGISISKLVQVIVLIMSMILLFTTSFKLKSDKFGKNIEGLFWAALVLILFTTLVGYINGNYHFPDDIEKLKSRETIIAALYPLIILFKYVFNYIYYTKFPQIWLRSPVRIIFFVKVFLYLSVTSFLLGWFEILYSYLNGLTIALIPRHASEYLTEVGPVFIGYRYHGLWGEPRDAISGLILLFSVIIILSEYSEQKLKPRIWFYITCIAALIATQSISLLVGLAIYSILKIAIIFIRGSVLNLSLNKIILSVVAIVLFLFFVFEDNSRFMYYMGALEGLFGANYDLASSAASGQKPNLAPLIKIYNSCFVDPDLSCLIGRGLSSVIYTNVEYGDGYIAYPFSDFVVLLHDVGLLGTALLIALFIYYLRYLLLFLNPGSARKVADAALLLFSLHLAQRSYAIWIFISFLIALRSLNDSGREILYWSLRNNFVVRIVFKTVRF